jgi:hypothetical protein
MQAFDVAEKHFGIVPIMTGAEMALMESLDMPVMYAYLVQFYEHFRKEGVRPAKGNTAKLQLYLLYFVLVYKLVKISAFVRLMIV